MSAALLKNSMYWLGNLLVGKQITPPSPPFPAASISQTEWTLQPGVYTPRQIVQGLAPLLDIIIYHLAPDPSSRPPRVQLLDNVAAILSTDTRESSLPFPDQIPDHSHREIRDQASRIGLTLVQWAHETPENATAPGLVLRSRCEGHLLLPQNEDLLLGPRSKPHLMQLFNEYLHQMVLLRDSLLPFQNYEDVLIPVSGSTRGLRNMEGPREKFMASLFAKQDTQTPLVTIAKALLAPDLPKTSTGGYGFQYAHGIVIPALFTDGPTPLHLLHYIPAQVDPSQAEVLFDYEFLEHDAAPREEIAPGIPVYGAVSFPDASSVRVESASLGFRCASGKCKTVRGLNLGLRFNLRKCVAVDLGQIARGWRCSFGVGPGESGGVQAGGTSMLHQGHDVLLQLDGGLVAAQRGGFHVVAVEEKIVGLAVLGKLYPGNVMRLERGVCLERAVSAGKEFGSKFVVWGLSVNK
ncbi:hypothetical protein BDW62DRAFT_219789 [Aspergillus aurantiobrunneus]